MAGSSRFVVSLHILTLLADANGRPVRSEDLGDSVNTNPVVIRALLAQLANAGITKAKLGNGGGAILAVPPARISLLDVYSAVEKGDIFAFPRTPPGDRHLVDRHITAILDRRLSRPISALLDELSEVTVQDLLDDVRAASINPRLQIGRRRM